MDAIESMDWGAYAHFRFQAQQLGIQAKLFPQLAQLTQDYFLVGSYVGVALLIVVTSLLFLRQGRRRGAAVSLLTFAAAAALTAAIQFLVPRRRPPDAQDWLGPNHMLGSYPASGVFLFMLVMILFGFASWSLIRRRWQRGLYIIVAALLTVAICMTHLFFTLNFVSDVIGAIVGAALFGWVAYRFLDRNPDTVTPTKNENLVASSPSAVTIKGV